MIVRLNREQQKVARRHLLNDVVYILSHDALRQLQSNGHTSLSPVEVFLSAQKFCEVVLALPDIIEGLDDEIEDLEEECKDKNETAMILIVASVQMQALSKRRIGTNFHEVIIQILDYLDGNELLMSLVDQMTRKEETRWMNGKKKDLLNYEMQEIELEGGGSEEVRRLFEDFFNYSDKMDAESIKGNLLILNRYNIKHNHAYDNEILSIYDKLGIKSTPSMNIQEYVALKQVDTEIQKVETGGTGVVKEIHK